MKFPPLIIALACVLCMAAVGCVQPAAGPAPAPMPNPFGLPGHCPPGCCPPGYQCPPGHQCQPGCPCQPYQYPPSQCPPGGCQQATGEVGVQVGASGGYPVNAMAQNEVKGGEVNDAAPSADASNEGSSEVKEAGCVPCRILAPQTRRPAVIQQPKAKTSPSDEVKHGAMACQRCGKATVGREWQEIWSDDGLSLMCMCKTCYRTATPLQREVTLRNYLSRNGIDTKKRPMVEAAVVEASRGY